MIFLAAAIVSAIVLPPDGDAVVVEGDEATLGTHGLCPITRSGGTAVRAAAASSKRRPQLSSEFCDVEGFAEQINAFR